MQKWYRIASPAVSVGQWAKGEDKVLLTAIQKSGVDAEHAIPWATLVPKRSLRQIKRRYKVMKNSIPNHNKLSFDTLVEKLVDKYFKEEPAAAPLELPAPEQLPSAAHELAAPSTAGSLAVGVAMLPPDPGMDV